MTRDGQVRFFGQYLVDVGAIDAYQLRQAEEHMYWINRNLGELGIREGHMTQDQVEEVLRSQEESDVRFGELAVQLGVLDEEQLEFLIGVQNENHTRIGESLVELGHLRQPEMLALLEAFSESQSEFEPDKRHMPDSLAGERLCGSLVETLPRFAVRTRDLRLKVGAWRRAPISGMWAHRVSVEVRGGSCVDVGLAADAAVAGAIVAARSSVDPESLGPDDLTVGLGRFLGQVILAAGAALRPAPQLQLGDVRTHWLPTSGIAFEFVCTSGGGWIVFQPR